MDIRNVTNMYGLFAYDTTFNQPIGNWDVSNVTNMNSMFWYTFAFNQPIGNWNVSNVTNMYAIFGNALPLINQLEIGMLVMSLKCMGCLLVLALLISLSEIGT